MDSVWDVVLAIGIIYVLLVIVISFHEASHYLVARLLGIEVDYVIIGVPPIKTFSLPGV